MVAAHFAIFARDVSPELCRELLGNVVWQRRETEKNMWELVLTSLALGVGLAMDACAVSMANGLNEPKMSLGKHTLIAGMFGFFQALMPMAGWLCVNTLVEHFVVIKPIIPYVSLALLLYVGIKMLVDGIRKKDEDEETKKTHLCHVAYSGNRYVHRCVQHRLCHDGICRRRVASVALFGDHCDSYVCNKFCSGNTWSQIRR